MMIYLLSFGLGGRGPARTAGALACLLAGAAQKRNIS